MECGECKNEIKKREIYKEAGVMQVCMTCDKRIWE